jgi:hypothetical protein
MTINKLFTTKHHDDKVYLLTTEKFEDGIICIVQDATWLIVHLINMDVDLAVNTSNKNTTPEELILSMLEEDYGNMILTILDKGDRVKIDEYTEDCIRGAKILFNRYTKD